MTLLTTAAVSYAEMAAKGPKQTPEEVSRPSQQTPFLAHQHHHQASTLPIIKLTNPLPQAAAPQPVEIEPTESIASSSLVDVDMPSVRTVTPDFLEQDVKTETQAARREREDEAAAAARRAAKEARDARDKAAAKARRADSWLTRQFADMSEGASSLLVVANFAAVVGVGAWLSYRAYGLYERGRLGWKSFGVGLGVVAGVAAVESFFAT